MRNWTRTLRSSQAEITNNLWPTASPTLSNRTPLCRRCFPLGGHDHRPLSTPTRWRIYRPKPNVLWCRDLTPPPGCHPSHHANWRRICSSPLSKVGDWSTTPWSGTLTWSCSSHCLCSLRFKDQSLNSTCQSIFHLLRPIVPTFLWTSPNPQRSHHIPFIIAPTCGFSPSTLQRTQFSHWWCNFCYHRGLNDYEIKLLSRWSSDCYKRCICSPLSLFLKVAPRIAQTKAIPYQYASPYHSST